MLAKLTTILICLNACQPTISPKKDEESGKIFMDGLNMEQLERNYLIVNASWTYAANITKENLDNNVRISLETAIWYQKKWKEVIGYPFRTFKDADLRRQFKKYFHLGNNALPSNKFEILTKTIGKMESIYSTAKICSYSDKEKCDLILEPDLKNLFINSNNPEELNHAWKKWRDVSGKQVRKLFTEYVKLLNEAATLNNYTDASEIWIQPYEDLNFRDNLTLEGPELSTPLEGPKEPNWLYAYFHD